MAPGDRTQIVGFAMGNEHDVLALLFENRGGRICSALLWSHNVSLLCAKHTCGALSSIYTAPYSLLLKAGKNLSHRVANLGFQEHGQENVRLAPTEHSSKT